MDIAQLVKTFEEKYSEGGDIRVYFAPGRVNLIGEHIDYNGGHVFPAALTCGNYIVARKRDDRIINFNSAKFPNKKFKRSLDDLTYNKNMFWTNYSVGVFVELLKLGYIIDKGLDIYVYGDIPGSGLSSSAALEVVTAVMLKDMFSLGDKLSLTEIAKLSQRAENNFCRCNCGIMDQFASAMGKKDKAILLDCATLKYEYVPLELGNYKIVVSNSNKPHSLANSHYNDRRNECQRALFMLNTKLELKNLCQLTPEIFDQYSYLIYDEESRKRARHAVYEEKRVNDSIEALKRGDIETFGRLLNESGDSLRYDYDATCFEIDTLVDEARKQEGVIGARETGGGWGGNTITLIREDLVDKFIENMDKIYTEKTKLKASFASLDIGEGGRRLL